MEVEYVEHDLRVLLTDETNEGEDGDFDPGNPGDYPRVRFYLQRAGGEMGWEDVEGGSYCTCLSASDAPELLALAARLIAVVVLPVIRSGGTVKHVAAEISWIGSDWFGLTPVRRTDPGAQASQVAHLKRLHAAFLLAEDL